MNIDYTLWPNTDGNLGNIKVQIPDGVNIFWPEGDALVKNFVYKDGKLVGFVDTKALTVNENATTTINYDYFDVELSSMVKDSLTINRGPRSKFFNVKWGWFNGDYMCYNPTTELSEFTEIDLAELDNIQLDKLVSAQHMFTGRSDINNIFIHNAQQIYGKICKSGKVPENTCLGIIYRGWINKNNSNAADIKGEYVIASHTTHTEKIEDEPINIVIDDKPYTFTHNVSSGYLPLQFFSTVFNILTIKYTNWGAAYNKDNAPYFIYVYLKDMSPMIVG